MSTSSLSFKTTPFQETVVPKKESLRIKRQRDGGMHIHADLALFRFIDKDTKQFVCYMPSIELSGYGDSFEKAMQMIKDSIDAYFTFLAKMGNDERDKELASTGWKKVPFHNKEFSKAFIDLNGELQNLNAEENSVQQMILNVA